MANNSNSSRVPSVEELKIEMHRRLSEAEEHEKPFIVNSFDKAIRNVQSRRGIK